MKAVRRRPSTSHYIHVVKWYQMILIVRVDNNLNTNGNYIQRNPVVVVDISEVLVTDDHMRKYSCHSTEGS